MKFIKNAIKTTKTKLLQLLHFKSKVCKTVFFLNQKGSGSDRKNIDISERNSGVVLSSKKVTDKI